MKLIIYFICFLLSACSSMKSDRHEKSTFNQFEELLLESKEDEIIKILGKPDSEQEYQIENVKVIEWGYGSKGKSNIQLILDASTKKLEEKVFLPSPDTEQADFSFVLHDLFKDKSFEKIKSKCSHSDGMTYFDKSSGVFIVTNKVSDIQVSAISYSTTSFAMLRLLENENIKCPY